MLFVVRRRSGRTPHLGHDRPNTEPVVRFPPKYVVDEPHKAEANGAAVYGPCKRKALASRQRRNGANGPKEDARKMGPSKRNWLKCGHCEFDLPARQWGHWKKPARAPHNYCWAEMSQCPASTSRPEGSGVGECLASGWPNRGPALPRWRRTRRG